MEIAKLGNSVKLLIILIAMAATGAGAMHSWHSRGRFVQAAGLSEAFTLVANVKLRVADYHAKHGVMPHDNSQAGLQPPRSLYGTDVKQISVDRGGHIFVEFGDQIGVRSMVFTPTVSTSNGALTWECSSDSIEAQVLEKLKPTCRFDVANADSRMMQAIANQDLAGLDAALANGADGDAVIHGNTPLMRAAKVGSLPIVERLLGAGVGVDEAIPRDERQTPLMVAINNGNERVMQQLLGHGASITRTDYHGLTALDYAIAKDQELGGNRFVVQISARLNPQLAGALEHSALTSDELLEQELELLNYYRELRLAASDCHVIRLATLFKQQHESDVDELVDGLPLTYHTHKPQCSAALTRFIGSKVVYQRAVQARFALAVRECDSAQMESMLNENKSLDISDSHGGIPHLDRAIKSGCADLVNVYSRSRKFRFPHDDDVLVDAIQSSPQSSLITLVGALIEAGANVDSRDIDGRSPLVAAISLEHPVIARYLVTAGADINGVSGDDWYPLVEAAKKGYTRVVKLLINEGVDINAQDNLGRTALMVAVNRGYTDLVSLLLKAGADIKLRDIHGVDAVVLAQTSSRKRIKNMLLAPGNLALQQ